MKLKITIEGKTYEVEVELEQSSPAHHYAPVAGGPAVARQPATPPAPAAVGAPAGGAAPSRPAAAAGPPLAEGAKVCKADLAGTVLGVKVNVGQTIARGDTILILEAMKMETPIGSPFDGTIKAIHVSAGEAVKPGQPMVEFE